MKLKNKLPKLMTDTTSLMKKQNSNKTPHQNDTNYSYTKPILRKFAILLIALISGIGFSWGQTAYNMSLGDKSWDFSDVSNWTNNFASGIDASNWGSVGIIGSGTSVTTGTRTTKSSATFATGTTGGIQKGTQSLVFLSTGSGTTPEAVAIDLFLDFTNRNVGTISFDWAAIDNGSGTRPTSLRVFWSVDGTTFTEISSAQILDQVSPTTGSITNIALPSQFNNSSTARLRFYNHAGSNAIGGGSRDKMQIDNITVTSTNASSCTTPSTQPTTFSSNTITTNAANINFTRGNGTGGVLVIGRSGSAVVTAPSSGSAYTANTYLGNGDAIGSGFVVYNGVASGTTTSTGNISLTNLSPNTTYHFAAYEYNTIDNCYNLTSPLTGNFTTLATEPTTQTSSLAFTNVSTTGFTIGWTNGNGANRIVLVKATNAVDANPNDATAYTANTTFGSGPQIGVGNYVVFNGTGNSVNVTGLSANTVYHVAVYEFNGSSTAINYLTSTPLTGSGSSLVTAPTTAASGVTITTKTPNSISLNWTNGNGSNRIVVARTSGTSATAPTNGTGYTVNSASFSDATNSTTAAGRITVYNGNGNSTTVNGLNAATSYSFDVYEYNGTGSTANYSSATSITVQYTLSTEPTAHAASFNATATTPTNINLNFSAASTLPASGYLLLKKASAFVSGDYPVDGNAYNVGSTIGENGATVNTVVTNNAITTSTGTNVSANLTVHYLLVPFNWDGTNTSTRNYFIGGTIPTANATTPSGASDVVAVVGSEPTTISSLINDEAPLTSSTGTQVWQFTIRDGGSNLNDADNLPTKISSIVLTQNAGNSVSSWNTSIKTVAIFDGNTLLATGLIGNPTNNITFSGLSVVIPDGQNKTLTIRLSLKNTLAATDDGKDFVFNLTNANITVSADGTSSGVASFTAINSNTAANFISVVATKLAFVQQPTNVNIMSAINPAVTLAAEDANGNRDLDYNTAVDITSTGTLSTTPQTAATTLGLATFNNIVHNAIDSAIQLTATSGTLTSAASNTFDVLLAPLIISEWNFTTATPTSADSKISFSAVSQGNNNGTTDLLSSTSASSVYAGSSGGNNAGAAARTGSLDTTINGSAYFEFTITPNLGYKVILTNVSFGSRSTSTGPQAYTLRSSVDNYTSDIFTGSLSNNSTWTLTANSSALNVLIDVGESVTFRIYGYNGSGSPGINSANWRIDDLKLSGYITDPIFYSKAVGNLNDLTTWGMSLDGTGTEPTSFTLAGATYEVKNRINPTISSHWTVSGTLDLKDNILDIGSNTLTVNGDITRTMGAIKTNGGTLILGGTNSSTIYFDQTTPGTTNKLKDLTVNRTGATVTLGNTLQVAHDGTVTVTAGTLTCAGNLTLVSTLSGTGRIAALGAGASITGNIEVQRFMVGGSASQRGWRCMSTPVSGATYAQLVDDIFITGPGGTTNGFDLAGNNSSVMYYEESATRGWKSISNTANTWTAGKGALVFFRGDRTQTSSLTNTNIAPNSFALDYIGSINSGDITVPLDYSATGAPADQGWNLIGNPYPSQIDWSLVNKSANTDNFYYVLNPNSKNYVSQNSGIIAIGQAFFSLVDAATSITFEESNKTANTGTAYFKTSTNPLTIKMKLDSAQFDVATLHFGAGASKNYVFKEDALKLKNSVYNLSFVTPNNKEVQNNNVGIIGNVGTDTFELKVTSTTNTSYTLFFAHFEQVSMNKAIMLVDKMTNSIINLRVTPEYTFSIHNNITNSSGNRFLLIITDQLNLLPVKLTAFTGKNNNKINKLTWTTTNEKNMFSYEVQRAADGIHFETIGLVKPNNTNTGNHYLFNDGTVQHHTNYYRLKMVDAKTVEYSKVIIISTAASTENLFDLVNVYPNPVIDQLNINIPQDAILGIIQIIDVNGKIVLETKQQQSIDLNRLKSGIYTINIQCNNKFITRKFIKSPNSER